MPRTKLQFEEMINNRKATILKASLYLFAIKGYSGTSYQEISKTAKCSHGLLFHYYPTKEILWNELFETKIKVEFRSIINNIDFTKTPDLLLEDLVCSILDSLKSENDELAYVIYLLLNIHLQKSQLPKPKTVNPKKRLFDIFYDVIDQGQKQGIFYSNNSKELAITVLSLFKGLSFNRINLGADKFICPNKETILRIVMRREEK